MLTSSTDQNYQTTFREEQLRSDELRGKEFEDCVFEKCQFDAVAFHFCRFIQCTFVECLFISIKGPNSIWDEVAFRDCKLSVFDWTEAASVAGLKFERCKLDAVRFGYMDIRKIVIHDCVACEVDFTEANMSDADFSGTDLASSVFLHTNLTKANFVGARNYLIDVKENTLKKARFSLPEAISLLRSFEIELV